MKKKLWIRLLGLLALLIWAVTAVLFRASMIAPTIEQKANVSLLMFLTFAAASVVTFVWAVFSVIDWALRRAAALRVAEARLRAAGELLNRTRPLTPPPSETRPASAAAQGENSERRGRGVMTSPLGLS